MLREHIIFSGIVQGVGFRYWSQYYANMYNLSGWVRNLFSGDVEMEVQGNKEDILLLISKLQEQKPININKISKREIPISDERGFEIRHISD